MTERFIYLDAFLIGIPYGLIPTAILGGPTAFFLFLILISIPVWGIYKLLGG